VQGTDRADIEEVGAADGMKPWEEKKFESECTSNEVVA
jgi:hypothetical protein